MGALLIVEFMKYSDIVKKYGAQTRTRPRHLEDDLQETIVRWFDIAYPSLKKCLVCVPNGGKRNAIEAARLKRMGVRAGFPDLIFIKPNKTYPYMGIELKTPKGRQSDFQKQYETYFSQLGAKYVVVRSVDEFIEVIQEYLNDGTQKYDNPTKTIPTGSCQCGG